MQKDYDFNTPIEKTSIELAKIILEKLNEKKDDLIFHHVEPMLPYEPKAPNELVHKDTSTMTAESAEEYETGYRLELESYERRKLKYIEDLEKYNADKEVYNNHVADNHRRMEIGTDLSIEIMKEISKSDISIPYATRCLDKIQIVLESLKKYIDGTINQQRHEYASRCLGAKTPDTGKYTEEYSTVGNLVLKLQEVRDSQGNKKSDYYNVEDDTLSTVDTGIAEKKD